MGDGGTSGAGDRRLIEDFLPIEAINVVAQREKIGHADLHPRKLHLWWARRPLAAARAAVYATLVPANSARRSPDEQAAFFDALCRWGGPPSAIGEARREVLAANDGKPPAVLDMFAGGGAIPLEAARLGCQATAIELNPVAHLIEKVMLEFAQEHPGLGDDVRRWGQHWVDEAWSQLADLYPPVEQGSGQARLDGVDGARGHSESRRPIAYLWTRTVRCPNPALPEHRLHLVRQTWLARKKGRSIALQPVVDHDFLSISYEVIEASSPADLGFDPASGSRRGEATCAVCGATVDAAYVKAEGMAGRMGVAPLAAVVVKSSGKGRDYLSVGEYQLPDPDECDKRLAELPIELLNEPIPSDDTRNFWVPKYGLTGFRDLFTPRQLLTLSTLAAGIRSAYDAMITDEVDADRAKAVATCLGLALDRTADRLSTLCHWDNSAEKTANTFARQALPMVWDFSEVSPFAGASGDIGEYVENIASIVDSLGMIQSSTVIRGSATALPLPGASFDAVVTDPPYYDNISYADLSDFFYVWLKRSVGWLWPDDLGGELTPKRNEAVVAPYRHHGDKTEARHFYEDLMAQAFVEAHRVLKPDAPLVCIYAHKTTLGWSTLVDALRAAEFMITEAWPLDTEMPERSIGQGTASLASSIFLVARKRPSNAGIGNEGDVLAELDGILRERLNRLTGAGVTGSDLVIATVGAGLRALTRYDRVEQDNGEPLPSDRFLSVVQNKVLDAIFGGLGSADATTRFYLAAQFSYGYQAVPFAEANNLGWMTGVEVDGPHGLTVGAHSLLAKSGSTVRLRDFEERGGEQGLGVPGEAGVAAPLIDVAQGALWLAEHRPGDLGPYLAQASVDPGLLRSVVQALAGKALRSGSGDTKPREAAAAERALGSWRRLVEDHLARQSESRLFKEGM